jgi:hypothetical protein
VSIVSGIRSGLRSGIRSGLNPSSGGLLFAIIGDSNAMGVGTGDTADTGFAVGTPVAAVPYNMRYSAGTGPPPAFIDAPYADMTLGSLALYAAPGSQSMGVEISLGSTLLAGGAAPAIVKYAVSGSTLATEWHPTSTYPAAGSGNLYHLWVARMHAFEVQTGRRLAGVVVSLGTNDAADTTNSTNFQTNMGAFLTQARIDFPGLAVAWIKTNPNTTHSPSDFTPTVIAGQVAYVAGDPLTKLVDNADLGLLGDGLHYITNGYLTLGQRAGIALLDLLGYVRRAFATTPSIVAYGPESHGSSSPISVVSGGDERDGDLEVLQVGLGIVAGSITTPSGWTLVATVSSTSSSVTQQMAVYRRAVTTALLAANNGHMPATSIAFATAATCAAKIYTVRGPNLNPTVDVSQTTSPDTFDSGPTTITGVTTTAANELVQTFTGGYCGSDPTMTVTGLTASKVQDTSANILTNRSVLDLWVGQQAVAGATGSMSASSSASMVKLGIVIGVKP